MLQSRISVKPIHELVAMLKVNYGYEDVSFVFGFSTGHCGTTTVSSSDSYNETWLQINNIYLFFETCFHLDHETCDKSVLSSPHPDMHKATQQMMRFGTWKESIFHVFSINQSDSMSSMEIEQILLSCSRL
jgi:hypothetical protein